MATNRPKLNGWQGRVPTADAALRESVIRVTANRPGTWGFLLAEVRTSRGWTLAAQAMALDLSESALVFLSICRSPRSSRRLEDSIAVAKRLGIPVATLLFVLDLAAEAATTDRPVPADGAA